MFAAVEDALPADVAIMVAAVADWRAADEAQQKLKKDGIGATASARAGRESGHSRHAVATQQSPSAAC